jgi:hypothetical protein
MWFMSAITPEQAMAYLRRWDLVRDAEAFELQRTPMALKLRQLEALMASREAFGDDPQREQEIGWSVSVGPDCERLSVPEGLPGSLRSTLADLTNWLNAAQIPWMVIGGVAASILGRP